MDSIGDYKIHPAANLFPMMDDASLAELVEDIRKRGLESPITEWQGQIIDGRNRLIACDRLGIEPTIAEIEDEKLDPVAYVLSLNLHRRHLDTSQRSMIAARIEELFKPANAEKKGGRPKKNGEKKPPPNLAEVSGGGDSREQAAKALNVSHGSVTNAKTLLQHGSPELIAAVERGEVSVSKAAKVAKVSPPEIQLEEATAKPPKKPRAKKNGRKTGPDVNNGQQSDPETGETIDGTYDGPEEIRPDAAPPTYDAAVVATMFDHPDLIDSASRAGITPMQLGHALACLTRHGWAIFTREEVEAIK